MPLFLHGADLHTAAERNDESCGCSLTYTMLPAWVPNAIHCMHVNTDEFIYADGTSARRIIVVMFIGGATFAEISGLRFLSTLPSSNAEFVVATTKLITGSSLLDSYIESCVRDALKDDASTRL